MAKSKPISAISGPSSAKEGKIRSVAVKSFSLLRAQLAKRGLREGASAYMFILNNLSSELGGPLRPFPTVGDEPSLLSQSGESMAGLSKTLAHQIRALCKENSLPQSSALSIVDAMKAQSLEADSVAVASASVKTYAAAKMSATAKTPITAKTPAAAKNPPSFHHATPAEKIASLHDTNFGRSLSRPSGRQAASSASSMRAAVPSISKEIIQSRAYEAKLDSLVRSLRGLMEKAPKMFGQIPQAKREYVEGLVSLIEVHQQAYKSGQMPSQFRFTAEEKNELHNFCPAFKLNGLEWLELEQPRAGMGA